MNNESAVAGFQFEVSGVDVTGASGGSSEASGFTISTSATTVLGFSLTGSTIEAGNGVLTQLTFSGSPDLVCLSDVILSDPSGNALEIGDNVLLTIGAGNDLNISHTGSKSIINHHGSQDLEIQRNAWGSQINSFNKKIQLNNFKKKYFNGIFIRAPKINKINHKKIKVLSSLNKKPVLIKYKSILGATFHPELTDDLLIHEFFINMIYEKK